jgi:hypothetical protein
MGELLEIHPDALTERGIPPLIIRVDATAAGMSPRLFPAKDAVLALNGPPGGPLVLVIWNCTGLLQDIEVAIRSRLVPPWTNTLELRHRDAAMVLGEHREGMTFFTGSGRARIAWFAVLIRVQDAQLLLACGVPGSAVEDVLAAEILSNPSISTAVETLHISACV